MRLPTDWINECLPNDLSLGDLADALTNLGLEVEAIEDAAGTPVLDIKVMSNRGDCLSLLGLARELATALRQPLRLPSPSVTETGPPAAGLASIVLDDPRLCPRYSARIVRRVRIAPSPEWAQRRLQLCGMRPINNVVDATNLVMLELGQPLHAFDYQLLCSRQPGQAPTIIVRRACPGERLVTIDGEERTLTPEVLVIADPAGPIALAGLMGGSSTEIHDATTDVLLESAHFDPRTVRRGARSLQMTTEASYRFERTVDPGGTVQALDRVCQLIAEFSPGAEIAQGVIDAYPHPIPETTVSLRPARANALLGLDLSPAEMASGLRRLQLQVIEPDKQGEPLLVTVPTFRQDLKEEIDLVEEVARALGYQRLPETLPRSSAGVGRLPADLAFERRARSVLLGLGLSEAVTSSLESPEALSRLGLPDAHPLTRAVTITNAKTVDRSQLRTTLLTSLLDVVSHNRRHGVADVGIFDLGRVYWSRGPDDLPDQPQHLGLAVTGLMVRGRWAAPQGSEAWDFHALKGIVEALLQTVALAPGDYAPDSHPCLQPGRTARLTLQGDLIGHLGELASPLRHAYDLPDPVYVAEFDLDLLRQRAAAPRFQPFGRFPALGRDIAFLVPRDVLAQRAETVIREAAGDLLESLSLFDAYEGPPLPQDRRNLAFSLLFRAPDRTLTDEEVDQTMARLRSRLRDALGAVPRE